MAEAMTAPAPQGTDERFTDRLFVAAVTPFAGERLEVAEDEYRGLLRRFVAADSRIGLIAAPEGLAVIAAAEPEVPVTVAAIDERLDERGFIVPGLGDAGDRMYGTK